MQEFSKNASKMWNTYIGCVQIYENNIFCINDLIFKYIDILTCLMLAFIIFFIMFMWHYEPEHGFVVIR